MSNREDKKMRCKKCGSVNIVHAPNTPDAMNKNEAIAKQQWTAECADCGGKELEVIDT